MARVIGRLTALTAARLKEKGIYPDGGGLYLQVTGAGAKSWIYRYTLAGRTREMGLGPFHTFDLKTARERAAECRRLRHDGIDPIDGRREQRADALEAARRVTFKDAAETYIESRSSGWKNAKHAEQWRNTLATYAYPVIGPMSVQAIDTDHVLAVLEPIKATKTETASRVRNRIEAVLDWATARKYRTGANPARWRGHLATHFPARSAVRRVVHHPALPYAELPAFMASLLKRMGRDDLTVHGFRSTFRDWAAEKTDFPREVAEMALAHTIGDKVEAAYRRGDLFQKRRELMEAWASYCVQKLSSDDS